MIEPGWQDKVLDFWFSELKPEDWYATKPEVDGVIRARFAGLHAALSDDVPDQARRDANTALAAIIVLDQFPRNMFRGLGKAFATDGLAAELARNAVDAGLDRDMTQAQKQFLYMPLMHSENLADQDRCVELFAAAGLENGLKYAREHRDIIARFGRFPYRNKAIGRDSTAEELVYLKDANTFGQ